MRGAFPGIFAALFIILTIVIGAMAVFWALTSLGEISEEDDTVITEDNIIFSKLSNKVTQEQLEVYLDSKAGAALRDSADTFYSQGERYDIDPAFAIAVARKETSLSKNTCASIPSECNNFFCIKDVDGDESDICYPWARYASPEEGIDAFYRLIKYEYIPEGQDTITEIGCHPNSGFDTHCYCVGEDTPYCRDWVMGVYSVPAFTEEIRNYKV
ncbi:MAG: glucosaminidase domain-containing protein [Candidatus Aenigmatarchaeota archaeon]|nr:MAG: glucosaminidase domain-containing protein [Candidatus Aenigmarchaeota archaeon]